ncbi:MAG: YdeI/OmpD-associated family protein [Actinomycetota bacterium]|nr:YdeI/OmpD-associated family protein [Actinomycetota bacterium]
MSASGDRENDVPDFDAALKRAGVHSVFNELNPNDRQAVSKLINGVKDAQRRERYIQVFVDILRESSTSE